jgi:hypothetical protein
MDRPTDVHPDDDVDDAKKRSGPRGGVNVPFPTKLHVMLTRVEDEGLTDIVGWQPHGRCFIIHKPREFVEQIMPKYFNQSKLTSFQRQLNLYGFRRLTTGSDRGGYYHEMFLKHKLFLCRSMTRIRIKGTGIKGKASPETEPNFYSMPEILPECDMINQRIETEVLTAMKEEESHMAASPRAKRNVVKTGTNQEPARRSKRSGVSDTSECSVTGNQLPSNGTKSFLPPALVTPDAQCSKAPVSFGMNSSSSRRCLYPESNTQYDLMDLVPPLHNCSSDHSLLSDDEYHSDERISFEGQHFHYLDSFAVHEMSKVPEVPEPSFRNTGMTPSRRYSSTISLPQLAATISDEDMTYGAGNPCAISSSSSTDTQFAELAQSHPHESFSFTPNTIFSGEGERGSWSIDIDREFLLMES